MRLTPEKLPPHLWDVYYTPQIKKPLPFVFRKRLFYFFLEKNLIYGLRCPVFLREFCPFLQLVSFRFLRHFAAFRPFS